MDPPQTAAKPCERKLYSARLCRNYVMTAYQGQQTLRLQSMPVSSVGKEQVQKKLVLQVISTMRTDMIEINIRHI